MIKVAGTVDVFTAPRLRDLLIELIRAGHLHFVVNVEDAIFSDSIALGPIIGAWRRVRGQGGMVALAGAPMQIRRPLDLSCFSGNIALYGSTGEAVRAMATAYV